MKQTNRYGWLSPGGRFFKVPCNDHYYWAVSYIHRYHAKETATLFYKGGDYLIRLGWILLHNPNGGPALFPDLYKATQKQKEFLYDYFIRLGRESDANKIWRDG